MHNCLFRAPSARRLFFLILITMLSLLLAGCPKAVIEGPGSRGPVTPQQGGQPQVQASLSQAQSALQYGNNVQAEQIARAFLSGGASSESQRGEAWRIIALASIGNNNPRGALTALESWRTASPYADAGSEWITAWSHALLGLPSSEATRMAQSVYNDQTRPEMLRNEANFVLQVNAAASNPAGMLLSMEELYNSAGSIEQKRQLENRFYSVLSQMDQGSFATLLSVTDFNNSKRFPYAIVALEEIRRLNQDPRTQGLAREKAGFLKDGTQLADPAILDKWQATAFAESMPGLQANTTSMAIILPLGEFSGIAQDINQGIEAAKHGFASSGSNIQIVLIDSSQPGWIQQVAALPQSIQVVGGPMRVSDYQALKSANLLGTRKFLTFLPRLDAGDEGVVAWRFFTSAEDQAESLITFGRSIGISSFAALVPAEEYGTRMLSIFQSETSKLGASMGPSSTYAPKGHSQWNSTVRGFSRGGYQAVYLPDSWQNAAVMMSYFAYNSADHVVFMGSTLWENELAKKQSLDVKNYGMAVFPGAWNPISTSPAAATLRAAVSDGGLKSPNAWSALGYDFANFAATLNIRPGANAAEVNSALSSANIPWSGAPMRWDSSGVCHQQLFIFTPSTTGYSLADPQAISQRLNTTR